jgi:hypothetical protein
VGNLRKRARSPWWEENREAFGAVNSFRMLAGRTTILDAVKPGGVGVGVGVGVGKA